MGRQRHDLGSIPGLDELNPSYSEPSNLKTINMDIRLLGLSIPHAVSRKRTPDPATLDSYKSLSRFVGVAF